MIENEILETIYTQLFEEPQVNQAKLGFRDLDEMVGRLRNSSIITIASRPAVGKTCFMNTIMLNLLEQNKKCLYFSLEISTEELIKKLIIPISEVDAHLFYIDEHLPRRKKEQKKILGAVEKLKQYDLTIYDKKYSVAEIRECIEANKPEFVFIDTLQDIDVPPKKPRSESFEKVMKDLKQIAKDNNCIIFMISQVSRAIENRLNKIPLLSDLRDSGAIENLSDIVIFIHREDYYRPYNDDDNHIVRRREAEIIVAKNKNGPIGFCKVLFRSSILKFMERVNRYEFE